MAFLRSQILNRPRNNMKVPILKVVDYDFQYHFHNQPAWLMGIPL